MGVKIKKTEYKRVPPGKYFATIDKIEIGEGKYGPQLNWAFKIEHSNPEFNGSIVTGLTGITATPKAKITRWFFACGITLTDEEIDTDVLYGRKVVATISENKQTKDGQETVWSNVTDIESVGMYQNVTPQPTANQVQDLNVAQTQPTPTPIQNPTTSVPQQQPIQTTTKQPQSNTINPANLTPDENINF